MSERRIHFEVITSQATEADDGDSEIACNTDAELEAEHLTVYPDQVTCKNCLRQMAKAKGKA